MDAEERKQVNEISLRLGRALCLTIVAAHAPQRLYAEEIAAMDEAWVELSDAVIDYAESE